MKESHKSDKIQAIIDEWSINYIGANHLGGKNLKMPQTASFIN